MKSEAPGTFQKEIPMDVLNPLEADLESSNSEEIQLTPVETLNSSPLSLSSSSKEISNNNISNDDKHQTMSSVSVPKKHRKRLSVLDFTASQNVPDLKFSYSDAMRSIDISMVLELCAVKIKDAVSGRFRAYRLKRQAIKWYLMYHKSWYRMLLMFVTLLHLSLVIIETPSSFNLKPPHFSSKEVKGRDHVLHEHNITMVLGDYYHISLPLATILETLCIVFHWLDIYVQYKLSGSKCQLAFEHSWYTIKFIVIFLMSINSFVSNILVFGALEHPFNMMRLLRPILFIEQLHNVRKLLRSVIVSFSKIKYVLTALFFIIFFFAVVATALFRGITGRPPDDPSFSGCNFLSPSGPNGNDGIFCSSFSKNCLDYWKTIPHSWMHLFTVLTTANYPDIMMPVVECESSSFIFFAIFIFLGLFFFLNLVLAIVTNSFSEDTTNDMTLYNDKKLFMLADSFAKLALFMEEQNKGNSNSNNKGNIGEQKNNLKSNTNIDTTINDNTKNDNDNSDETNTEINNRHERLKNIKKKQTSKSSRGSTHSYVNSKSSFANMISPGGSSSTLDNVGWGWSRVKVRRGQNDPFSLLDASNVDLTWQRKGVEHGNEYPVVYEAGDIVITNGIQADIEVERNLKKEYIRSNKSKSLSSSISNKIDASQNLLRASSHSTRRIFVALDTNVDLHPMSRVGGQYWKEIRLNAVAWSNFIRRHFSHINLDYAMGHFNYLHDVKCNHKSNSHRDDNDDDQYHQLNTFNGRTSLKNIGRVSSLNDIKTGNTLRLDTSVHKNYSIAFEDFMITLVPVLDARRVDLCLGKYKCNDMMNITHIHQKYSCLSMTRKKMLLFYHMPLVTGIFDILVVFNTILLVLEIVLEDEWGSNLTLCNDFVVSLCVLQGIILCIFVAELITKIYAFGLPRFWRSLLNKIDLIAIISSFGFLIYNGLLCGLQDENLNVIKKDGHEVFEDLHSSRFKYCNGSSVGYNWSLINNSSIKNLNLTKSEIVDMVIHIEANAGASLSNFITLFRIIRIFRLFRVLRSVSFHKKRVKAKKFGFYLSHVSHVKICFFFI